MGIIYKLTSPSGKIYIGQTTRSFQQRLKEHITQSGCVILSFALKKYGFENFEKEILITCDDDLLNIKEIEYIKLFNSLEPNGYNIRTGGSAGKEKW